MTEEEERRLAEAEAAQNDKSQSGQLQMSGVSPAPSAEAEGRTALGVGDPAYRASVKTTPRGRFGFQKGFTRTTKVAPRYFVGDEFKPRKNSWTGAQIADLQTKMVKAGLLKKGSFQLGVWDKASIAAYELLLGYANASGKDATQELMSITYEREKYGVTDDEATKRPPLRLDTTHPDDLRGAFREVTKKMLGRALPDDELEKYISAYNQIEIEKQTEAYNLSDPEGQGGQMVAPPAANSFIEEKIRKERPTDVAATAVNERADEFFSLLGAFNSAGD